ncbi:hypothetical protein FPY71_09980 [Aureimonas fodinaquatilis]|uniref:Uncharacterized protein n=1 Tax=Aureimonas fodinaquatilis TaxID=2565783 RepID=A0A5B0DVN0_9HYPH|nr:hypothetical protein [Aureimonas fodinaquatilis]KAA0970794.1 hypothetical protein FPY71_09980 [Aureimonas fodinaquatilis]
METVRISRTMGLATVVISAGISGVAISAAPVEEGNRQTIRLARIQSTAVVYEPTFELASNPAQDMTPAHIPAAAVVHPVAVSAGSVTIAPAEITSSVVVHEPTVEAGPVDVLPTHVSSTSLVHPVTMSAGPVNVAPILLASTAIVYAPHFSIAAPWYDDPLFDTWAAGVDWNNDRAFMPVGPKVGGKYPKREAAISEIITIEGPAGRSYIPVNGLPFSYDTLENAPRYDWQRGRRQWWIDPVPRFNRIYNAAIFITPVTIHMINYSYLFSFYGTGYVECTGDTVPGGSWRLDGTGADEMVWAFLPHPDSGDVTVTPHGDVRFINVDTHGVTGLDPNYPTNFIPTASERVDRAREHAVLAPDIVAMLGQAGSMLIQGQFTTGVNNLVPGGNNRRVIVGWDHDAYLGIDGSGNVVNNTGHGNLLSTPMGSGDSYDPFRLVFSFLERDLAGGDGIRRVAANGGAVAQHAHPWQGGPGDHTGFTLARVPNWFQAQDAGAGGYDLMLFSPELMAASDVQQTSRFI